jgi:hypothetical protein
MTLALIIVTVVEIVLVLGIVAAHLKLLDDRLKQLTARLGAIAFGVNAVEWQTGSIGRSVLRLNAALRDVAGALPSLVNKAEQAAGARR